MTVPPYLTINVSPAPCVHHVRDGHNAFSSLVSWSHLGDVLTTTHEHRYMEYVRVLFTNLGVMHSMLAELGPGFVMCHTFEDMGNIKQTATVANFVAPNEIIAGMLTDALRRTAHQRHGNHAEDFLFEGADVVAARLQRKLDAFEPQYCGLG